MWEISKRRPGLGLTQSLRIIGTVRRSSSLFRFGVLFWTPYGCFSCARNRSYISRSSVWAAHTLLEYRRGNLVIFFNTKSFRREFEIGSLILSARKRAAQSYAVQCDFTVLEISPRALAFSVPTQLYACARGQTGSGDRPNEGRKHRIRLAVILLKHRVRRLLDRPSAKKKFKRISAVRC